VEIKLPEAIAHKLGKDKLRKFEIEEDSFTWKKYATVNLRHYTTKECEELLKLVEPLAKEAWGGKVLVKDIKTWLEAIKEDGAPRARNVENFTSIITEIVRRTPGHRLFKKNDIHGDAWLCYYVNRIEYHPERIDRDYHHPAYCSIGIIWEEFGGSREDHITFYDEDCYKLYPEEALARKDFYLETPDLRKSYLQEISVFKETVNKIGKQYFAKGFATDDLDGNKGRNHDDWWWHSRTNRIILDKNGEQSRVVIDLFKENDKEERGREVHIDSWFWSKHGDTWRKPDKEDTRGDIDIEDAEELPTIEVPIHPFLACFDLRRHLRLRIHVNYLTPYVYNKDLGEMLVLPREVLDLVEMLLANKGIFKDIVAGKGGGAVVLCSGPPGTGKTLTAEVYAEVMARPLYSVQASQLGTDPNALEDELLKVFARSQRWNAILLLDEADVYVHSRGNDLTQNAIVGVFLRVLEYYNGVLFLTTNRADLVDDAIASRCMARIEYAIPTKADQAKIWCVLSEVAEVRISKDVIAKVVEDNPRLSGRDVKNLLKLAKLISDSKSEPITVKSIEFVKRFKPTVDVER
jgi:hypothetical protein